MDIFTLIFISNLCILFYSYQRFFCVYHARHQPSLTFPGTTNVGREPSQSGSTLDGFGSRDLQVFAEAKPSIQLHTQVLNALFPFNIMFFENDLRVFEGSPVREQQRLGLFRHLLSYQRFVRHRLPLIRSFRILTSSAAHTTSASSAKPMMLVPAGRSRRWKSSYMTFQTSGPTHHL